MKVETSTMRSELDACSAGWGGEVLLSVGRFGPEEAALKADIEGVGEALRQLLDLDLEARELQWVLDQAVVWDDRDIVVLVIDSVVVVVLGDDGCEEVHVEVEHLVRPDFPQCFKPQPHPIFGRMNRDFPRIVCHYAHSFRIQGARHSADTLLVCSTFKLKHEVKN